MGMLIQLEAENAALRARLKRVAEICEDTIKGRLEQFRGSGYSRLEKWEAVHVVDGDAIYDIQDIAIGADEDPA